MQIILHGTEAARQELLQELVTHNAIIHQVVKVNDFLHFKDADVFIDLSFENRVEEIALLRKLNGVVIINSVSATLAETDSSFIRINAWPQFLKTTIIEGSYLTEEGKKGAELVFSSFNKTIEWLPDEPGFITPRVISMIINEAYLALEEGVSTREEIDIAMKLGTAYPFGPFEWGKKIGLNNIVRLLTRLSREKEQYAPAALLIQEALTAKD